MFRVFRRHQRSTGIFFSFLSMKNDIEVQNEAISRFLRSNSTMYVEDTVFLEGRFCSGGLSLEAIDQSSGSSFRDFFVKTIKDS